MTRRLACLTAAAALAVSSLGIGAYLIAADKEAAPAAASAHAIPADAVSLRIRMGLKDKESTDWSGKIDAPGAQVVSIEGVRWMQGDSANGNNFTVQTRRQLAQSSAQRDRVQAGFQLPMDDNGVVVTLSGAKPDAPITVETKQGKASFKVADVPMGQKMAALDGAMEVSRVPAVQTLANGMADEDYPCSAVGKDGTVYMTYLAFTHGKDFPGVRERPTTPESGPNTGPLAQGDIRKIEKDGDFDYLRQPTGGEVVYLRAYRNGAWTEPVAVTDGKNEYYRPAVAVDGSGKVWVFYSAQLDADKNLDHGNWEMMARSFDADAKTGGKVINVSNAKGNDFMPSAATDASGKVWVAWVGSRDRNFVIHAARQEGDGFGKPQAISKATSNSWEANVAASADGRLAIAYDTYDRGDYDIYVAMAGKDGKIAAPAPVAATDAFEVRPNMAFDGSGQLWLAYEAAAESWGKDWGALKHKGSPLYMNGRWLGVKVMKADGAWQEPEDEIMDAMPDAAAGRKAGGKKKPNVAIADKGNQKIQTNIAPCYPRLTMAPGGQVFLTYRGRPGGNWRVNVGSVWVEYISRLDGKGWSDAALLPHSNNILDNRPAVAMSNGTLMVAFSGDGRGEMLPAKVGDPHLLGSADGVDIFDYDTAADFLNNPASADETVEVLAAKGDGKKGEGKKGGKKGGGGRTMQADPNNDLYVAMIRSSDFGPDNGTPKLKAAEPVKMLPPTADTESERSAVKTMRDYRYNLNGEEMRVWRGEFHRHTEFSPDGGNDGGLLDLWRYAIDAVSFDWIGDGDHDFGNGREYSWWTTQKAVTLYTLPGAFTPVFSYERSVSYPEGHRNCMFAERGIRSLPRLPITSPDDFKPAPDTNMLYKYLHHFNGLCASHTSATGMGTDWRNNDPTVEPLVEIYQGDRNNYERPDAPRSAVTEAKLKNSTPEKESLGGWRPKGFVNLALLKGYRLAFESSSDHQSTHLSYTNAVITGEPSREAVLEAIRKRRVYGATDNIVADVRCKAGGKEHFMGEEFSTKEAPTIDIKFIGAQKIKKVVIVKDDVVVHEEKTDSKDIKLSWTDPNPTAGKTSYYYVRGEQEPDMEGVSSGELVWASPMWIKYEK